MSRTVFLAALLGAAVSYSFPAAARDLFDEGVRSRCARCAPAQRGASGAKEARGEQAPRQVYNWPDARYYGRHGMMLD